MSARRVPQDVPYYIQALLTQHLDEAGDAPVFTITSRVLRCGGVSLIACYTCSQVAASAPLVGELSWALAAGHDRHGSNGGPSGLE